MVRSLQFNHDRQPPQDQYLEIDSESLTLLSSDTIPGTSVKYVLQQNKAAFVRLVGVSILQSGVSSFLAPSLRFVSFTIH